MQVRLADLTHSLPVPGTARLFSQEPEGEEVDISDSFWAARISDGSVVAVEAAEDAPAAAPLSIPASPDLSK